MVLVQLIYIFLRSISYQLMLRFLMCNGQITHLASDHFALTSNLSVKIDWTKFQKDDNLLQIGQKSYENLHLRYYQSENETREKCAISVKYKQQTKIEFRCKCFDRAGKYDIVLINSSTNEVNVVQNLNVFWPLVNVYLPEYHTALTDNGVTVKLKYKLGCTLDEFSLQQSSLEIWYSNSADPKLKGQFKKVKKVPISNWWTLDTLTLSCKHFDRAGLFKVMLLSSVNSTSELDVISESNMMRVQWYNGYKLKTVSGSIYPCPTSGIAVTFDGPSCDNIHSRIRLWAVIVNDTVKSKNMKYIGEEIVFPTKSVVNFGCNYFDLIYLEYCFQYVTVLNDGTEVEHARQCVINQKSNFMPVHGQWSTWREWGPCTTSCGAGVQHRVKLCDTPKPKFHGKFCDGTGMETKDCDIGSCPNATTSNNHVDNLLLTSPCQCGCHLTKEETIVIESLSCTNLTIWTIEAPSNFFIKAKILSFNFVDYTSEWLKIRQGLNESGQLLFDSKVNSNNFEDISFLSKSSRMRIEYLTHKESTIATIGAWRGALIKINFVEPVDGMLSKRLKDYSFLLFVILPITSLTILTIVLCLIWCCLFKTAKRKLASKCNLLRSRSCGSVKEIDPLIDDRKSFDITNSTLGDVRSDSTIERTGNNSNRQTVIQVIIENGADKEKQPLLSTKLRGKETIANNLPQIPEEMFTSTHTQSTRLSTMTQKSGELSPPASSAPKTVRSIGIQLSSPALPLKRQFSFGSKVSISTPSTYNNCHKDIPENRCESPTVLSIAGTEHDFEYDYSEYAVPGSIFNPEYQIGETFLQSDISIDDIIAQSDLMKSPSPECSHHEKSSVSTQIQNDSEFCVKLPKKSMKQFHFL